MDRYASDLSSHAHRCRYTSTASDITGSVSGSGYRFPSNVSRPLQEDSTMKIWFAGIVLAFCLLPTDVWACSTFIATGSNAVLVANNKDLRPSDQNAMLFISPAASGRYGKMFWGRRHTLTQCGVNEAGLFVDVSPVPSVASSLPKGTELNAPLASLLLDRCATVEEALDFIRQHHVRDLLKMHMMLSDKSGASAIVEWDGSELHVLPKSGAYQIMTNFRLSDPAMGGHPCYRYNSLLRMLRSETHSPQLLRKALDFTHQEDLTYYSNLIDLSEGSITVFGNHNFGQSRTFVLADMLQQGAQQFTLDELFPQRRVDKSALELRNGLVYEIGSDTPFSGICVQKHENGTLLKEGLVKNGRCAGCWKYFDEDGVCIDEENYRRVLLFFDSGHLRAEGMLKNNMMVGEWQWMNEDGTPALKGKAIDGMFYRDGENLPYSGKLTVTYRNGKTCSERNFVRGLLDGEALDWYDNGHVRVEGYFEDGRHAKRWRFYRRDGGLERTMNYEDYVAPVHQK